MSAQHFHARPVLSSKGVVQTARHISMAMISATAVIISTAMVITAIVIGPSSPPDKWPWVNIHIGVDIGTLHFRSGGLNRRFASGVDQRTEYGVTDTGSLESDDLVSR